MSESTTTQESRSRILHAIEQATDAITVEDIAEQTALHVNTVRGHLDVLLATDVISRESADHRSGPGRPRWLYRAAEPKSSPYQALAEALTMQLSEIQGPAMAQGAADRWADGLPIRPVAVNPDAAVVAATDALNSLGFTAVANPLGDAISITDCPYVELVDANPVICDIHAALLSRILEQTGQPVSLESMDVWAGPGLCQAKLRRPDLTPSRVITTIEPRTSNEGNPS